METVTSDWLGSLFAQLESVASSAPNLTGLFLAGMGPSFAKLRAQSERQIAGLIEVSETCPVGTRCGQAGENCFRSCLSATNESCQTLHRTLEANSGKVYLLTGLTPRASPAGKLYSDGVY